MVAIVHSASSDNVRHELVCLLVWCVPLILSAVKTIGRNVFCGFLINVACFAKFPHVVQ